MKRLPWVKRFIGICCVLLGGCAWLTPAPQSEGPIFDEVIVTNTGSDAVNDFKIIDQVSHRYFGCNLILPGTSCAIGFSKRVDEHHAARITWRVGDRHYSAQLVTEYVASQTKVKKVYIELLPPGAGGALFHSTMR